VHAIRSRTSLKVHLVPIPPERKSLRPGIMSSREGTPPMMDSIRQMQDLARSWTEAQQKTWSDMLGVIQDSASAPAESWNGTIDLWERSVNQALDAQAEWVRAWGESVTSGSRVPEDARDWALRGQEAFEQWNKQQKQLWGAWFSMSRQLLASSGGGSDQVQRVLQAWQDAVRQAMKTQSDWTQRWAEGARQSAPEAKERGSRR